METLSVRRGETLTLTIYADDDDAQTATLTVAEDGSMVLSESASFNDVDGKRVAVIEILSVDLSVGDYQYQLGVAYEGGITDILPDPDGCEGDCDLPTFKVCTSIAGAS